MHSTHSVGQANSDGSDILQDALNEELAHWTAVEADAVRECRARQGGSTGAVPISAPAAVQPPAPPPLGGHPVWRADSLGASTSEVTPRCRRLP